MKDLINKAQRIVIKVGTRVLVDSTGRLVLSRLSHLVEQVNELRNDKREVLLVTSAAVALGKQSLSIEKKLALHEKQACAAIGQGRLMHRYSDAFANYGVITAQVLLTTKDLQTTENLQNLRSTIEELFRLGAVPIVNENDSVSIQELKEIPASNNFGDNDKLSAILACELSADLLLILTNVNGLYANDTHISHNTKPIASITDFDQLSEVDTSTTSLLGKGGMASKIKSAQYASSRGIPTILTSGLRPQSIMDLFKGQLDYATMVPPAKTKLKKQQ